MDKSRFGLIFKSPRLSRARQEELLSKGGASWIVDLAGTRRTWRDGAKLTRPGDVVFIPALSIVPTARGEDDLPPSAQPGEFITQVHERGGYVVEVLTGRKSNNRSQREAMIKEAVTTIRRGTRELPKTGRKRGRPKTVVWTDEQKAAARDVWFSRDYATNRIAAKHLPKGMTEKHAWELFKGSGRPFPKPSRKSSKR